ncbi:hypothetical protein D3C75_1341910 [compost metagenome]
MDIHPFQQRLQLVHIAGNGSIVMQPAVFAQGKQEAVSVGGDAQAEHVARSVMAVKHLLQHMRKRGFAFPPVEGIGAHAQRL